MFLDFDTAIQLHENRLRVLAWRLKNQYFTEGEFKAAWLAERLAWSDIRLFLNKRGYQEHGLHELTEEEIAKYKAEYPLVGVMTYRGIRVPIYDDDAGQQCFTRYDGHDIAGGAYNLDYCEEFAIHLDEYLDQALINKFLYGE